MPTARSKPCTQRRRQIGATRKVRKASPEWLVGVTCCHFQEISNSLTNKWTTARHRNTGHLDESWPCPSSRNICFEARNARCDPWIFRVELLPVTTMLVYRILCVHSCVTNNKLRFSWGSCHIHPSHTVHQFLIPALVPFIDGSFTRIPSHKPPIIICLYDYWKAQSFRFDTIVDCILTTIEHNWAVFKTPVDWWL